jgi:hypothetical protein
MTKTTALSAWYTYIVVSYPPATEEIGAMGREIESRQGIGYLGSSYKIRGYDRCGIDSM